MGRSRGGAHGRRGPRWQGGALELHVRVSPDDEVAALRERVAALEAEAAGLRERAERAEFRYRCECTVNMELTDLCRARGVDFRPALGRRPW